jgi:nicotinate-nucleotide adenylyltransferase
MKIALFGTSADPPTIAHQEIVAHLATKFHLTLIWAADNPFKQHGADLDTRSNMLELLVAEIDRDLASRIKVDRRLSYRYTIDTITTVIDRYPDSELTIVIGADLITQLPTWYRASELINLVNILILPRNDREIDPDKLKQLTNFGAKVEIDRFLPTPVSSTAIRSGETDRGVTPAIANYIHNYRLYQSA